VKRWVVLLTHVSVALLGLSGIAYGLMKYFLPALDPDSRVSHPWQQPALKIHILAAPFLIFALGLLLCAHAFQRLRSGEEFGRRSGIGLIGLAAPLILSGSLIQTLTGDAARRWTGWLHAALGVLYVVGYVAHMLKRRSSSSDAAASLTAPPAPPRVLP
jgi:hypothetical protein